MILGSLAIGLLNFGDRVGRISAGLFTFVAMGAMIYALATFHWRAAAIRKRGQGSFDDRFGPTVLVCTPRYPYILGNHPTKLWSGQTFAIDANRTLNAGDYSSLCRCRQLRTQSFPLNR